MGMLDSVVSKIPFTSGILGFGEFYFCSFVAHLKTIPFPFKSTRGRYDPCFGPPAPPPTLPPPPPVWETWSRRSSACLFVERDGKGHYLSCSLELQLDKGSSYLLLFWSHISSLCQMLSSHFAGWGTQAHSSETMGLRLLGFPVVASDPHLLLPTHSFGHLSLGFNRLPLFLTGLWKDNLHRYWLAEFESVFDRIGIGAEQHVDQSVFQ